MLHWMLIADASGARVIATAAPFTTLTLVHSLPNPQGRLLDQELVSDDPGRVSKAGAVGTRAAMSPRTSAHDEAAETFARTLANMLHREAEQESYSSLSIVAPPHFLGLLRSMLTKDVAQRLTGTLPRDLVHVPLADIKPHVESLLATLGLMSHG